MKTVIFDMDGVIFDTERRTLGCWQAEADRLGLGDIRELYMQCVGTTGSFCEQLFKDKYPHFPPYQEFRKRPSQAFHELNEQNGMPVKPGIQELLQYLKTHDYHIGMASSTQLKNIKKELAMAGLDSYFDQIIGGDLVKKSKPDPDIYLTACKAIGSRPEETYAIEDSYNGIRSAAGAGMMPIMIPDLLPPTPEMEALSVAILPDLVEAKRYFIDLDARE